MWSPRPSILCVQAAGSSVVSRCWFRVLVRGVRYHFLGLLPMPVKYVLPVVACVLMLFVCEAHESEPLGVPGWVLWVLYMRGGVRWCMRTHPCKRVCVRTRMCACEGG